MIEPRFLAFPNDGHPTDSDSMSNHLSLPAAEQLILKIYMSIRNSLYRDKTLFLITFDEGGLLFDHSLAPRAKSPYPADFPTEMGFDFKRLGQRVPFLAISSWISSKTVIKKQLQHSSLIRTLARKFHFPFINNRDRYAPSYPNRSLFTRKKPRSWPDLQFGLAPDFMSPLQCVNPTHNPLLYLLQKHCIDHLSKDLCKRLFQSCPTEELYSEVTILLYLIKDFHHCCDKVKQWTGISFQPLFKVRFFCEKEKREMNRKEGKHRAKCIEHMRLRHKS
jgi:hypothetical protein